MPISSLKINVLKINCDQNAFYCSLKNQSQAAKLQLTTFFDRPTIFVCQTKFSSSGNDDFRSDFKLRKMLISSNCLRIVLGNPSYINP